MPILKQDLIKESHPATQILIDNYMKALCFKNPSAVGHFRNNQYDVWDSIPRNVLVDEDGDIFVEDAEIKPIVNNSET